MATYLGLIAFILFSSLLINTVSKKDSEHKKAMILAINIFVIWLLCALKKETVGVDIAGYKRVYENTASMGWFSYSAYYFEIGYMLLMQLFSKAGFPFQVFNAFVYMIIYIPWYVFLKKYSKQPTLSLLIYVCYQFWVFNMSGLRQGIAMSICLLSYMALRRKTIWSTIFFAILVFTASTIHRSAIIFFAALGVLFVRPGLWTIATFVIACGAVVGFRGRIVGLLNSLGSYHAEDAMVLGGSFLMLCAFTAFSLYIDYAIRRKTLNKNNNILDFSPTYMMMCAIGMNLGLNGSVFLRAASYSSCFLTIALPNSLSKCDKESRTYISFAFGLFLIGLFIHDVLIPNQLEIIPYRFFWQ